MVKKENKNRFSRKGAKKTKNRTETILDKYIDLNGFDFPPL
jgi:hypothetical protein